MGYLDNIVRNRMGQQRQVGYTQELQGASTNPFYAMMHGQKLAEQQRGLQEQPQRTLSDFASGRGLMATDPRYQALKKRMSGHSVGMGTGDAFSANPQQIAKDAEHQNYLDSLKNMDTGPYAGNTYSGPKRALEPSNITGMANTWHTGNPVLGQNLSPTAKLWGGPGQPYKAPSVMKQY